MTVDAIAGLVQADPGLAAELKELQAGTIDDVWGTHAGNSARDAHIDSRDVCGSADRRNSAVAYYIRYDISVRSANLIRDMRLRAKISQAELAKRVNTSQPAIARWEAGTVEPSLERVRQIGHACGYELLPQLIERPDENLFNIRAQLALTPAERLQELTSTVAFLDGARRKREQKLSGGRSKRTAK